MLVMDVSRERADLLRLLAEVEQGEEAVIARHDKPVAKLVGLKPQGQRKFGALQGRISVDDRFFEPLPPEELVAWENCADPDSRGSSSLSPRRFAQR